MVLVIAETLPMISEATKRAINRTANTITVCYPKEFCPYTCKNACFSMNIPLCLKA